MHIIRIFLFLTFSICLTSHNNSSIIVEARLIKQFKVYSVDKNLYFEFIKFKIIETNNIFLVNADYEKYPKNFFKKNRIYKITYGEGTLWKDIASKYGLKSNKNLEKYPVYYMLEIKKIE